MSGSNGLLDAIAHPTTVNPLAAYSAALQVNNGINQNKLFQSQQAAGQAALGAIGPDGSFSASKLNQNLAADPTTALSAQDSMQKGSTNATTDFDLHMKRLTMVQAAAMALAAQHPNGVPQEAVNAEIDRVGPQAGLSPTEMAQAKASFGPDPVANSRTIIRNGISNLTAQDALHASRPGTGTVDQGPTLQPIQTAPAAADVPGAVTPVGPAVPVGLPTAAQKIQPVAGPATPKGQPTQESLGSSLTRQGLDANGNPIPNPAFAGLPSALRGPKAQPATGTPVATGAGPAATSAMSAGGTASSATYQGITDAATKAVGQRALLQNMAGDATAFTTGPGASTIKDVKATIQRIGATVGTSFGIDPAKLAANEDLDKVANQLADAQGAGSDARLSVNQGANPSSHNTPAGLHLILNKLIGNSDFIAAKGTLAAQYQKIQDPTGEKARQFNDQVNQQLDPRVFQFNRMDRDQQKQYLTELGAGKDSFKQKYLQIKSMGILPGG